MLSICERSMSIQRPSIASKERTRAQQWTASLLHANGLAELQSLVLVGVPVRVKDLETVLVRCSCTLENLELDDLIPGGGSQQAWLRILEQLATMERLCTLKLVLSDRIFPDLHAAKALTTFGFERQIQRYGKGHFYTLSLPNRRELLEGPTKLLESGFGRVQVVRRWTTVWISKMNITKHRSWLLNLCIYKARCLSIELSAHLCLSACVNLSALRVRETA
jgi:hypothetical protein